MNAVLELLVLVPFGVSFGDAEKTQSLYHWPNTGVALRLCGAV